MACVSSVWPGSGLDLSALLVLRPALLLCVQWKVGRFGGGKLPAPHIESLELSKVRWPRCPHSGQG